MQTFQILPGNFTISDRTIETGKSLLGSVLSKKNDVYMNGPLDDGTFTTQASSEQLQFKLTGGPMSSSSASDGCRLSINMSPTEAALVKFSMHYVWEGKVLESVPTFSTMQKSCAVIQHYASCARL